MCVAQSLKIPCQLSDKLFSPGGIYVHLRHLCHPDYLD